jgi:nucleotide-binding universal stress UspA family protein
MTVSRQREPDMKTILVPTLNSSATASALETAAMLGERTGAYIEGFAFRFGIPQYAAFELAVPFAEYEAKAAEEIEELRRLFETFMLERGIPSAATASDGPRFGWLPRVPEGEVFVGSYGRAFDVTVLSRPDVEITGPLNRVIEAALFDSGRPVLLAPPHAPRQIASNIMIHWNGSTEQARANSFATPLLHLAKQVTVLTVVGGQDVPGPSVDQILRQLHCNGIAAESLSVDLDDRSTGEAVLDAARAKGCDLLIKGAFTRHRLRQMVFGGATSHILQHADLPVLMAH